MVLAGVANGSASGPYIQDFCIKYLDRSTFENYGTNPTAFLIFDDSASRTDYATLSDKYRFNAGMGVWVTHTGWTNSDSMFGVQMQPYYMPRVDHVSGLWASSSSGRTGSGLSATQLGTAVLPVTDEARIAC